MPADATVSGLHLAQSLPIMKPFPLITTLNLAIANAASATFVIGTFTMPFYGDMSYQGWLRIDTAAAGVQQPNNIIISALSVPAPTSSPAAQWRTEGGPGFAVNSSIPLIGSWVGVAGGTAVTVRASVTNGGGGIAITVVLSCGIMFCTKT
jgi:hypothetical protein